MKKQKKLENELQALRTFIEAQFIELRAELRRMVGPTQRRAEKVAAPISKPEVHGRTAVRHDALTSALAIHKRGKDLIKAGQTRDQLLRSLIPLYLARGLEGIEVNSGAISAFWKMQGVAFAGPNAAKALRGHIGNANPSKSKKGWVITPNGVKYVEAALGKRLAA